MNRLSLDNGQTRRIDRALPRALIKVPKRRRFPECHYELNAEKKIMTLLYQRGRVALL
jgi:hypothetical protein